METGRMISQLRTEKGLNQRDFAKLLGVSNGSIGMWETGKRQPYLDSFKRIAAFFSVTVDYLIGNIQSCIDYANYQIDTPEFILDFKIRIRDLMTEYEMTEDEFTKKAGFHSELKDAYLYGNQMPSIEEFIKIARSLNVSTYYLLDVSRRKRITAEEELLLQSFNHCDDECKKYRLAKAGVLCVKGISTVAVGEYGKCTDEEKNLILRVLEEKTWQRQKIS